MKTNKKFNSAVEECPRFDFCNINNCLLHEDYNKKFLNDSSDPAMIQKQKCIAKSIRKRIALKWNLLNKGMTQRELSAQQKWNSLPESLKQERIDKLKKVSPVSRLLASGHTIIPPSKKQVQNPHINGESSPKNNHPTSELRKND